VASPAGAQSVDDSELVNDRVEFPTNMALAPDGRIFYTEKDIGEVRIIRDGELLAEPFAALDVIGDAERGLLGIALHPDFPAEPWVYLYYSDADSGRNRIVRIRAEGNRGTDIEPIIELLPADSGYHNGGDMAFGPDGMLYAVVGETHDPDRAQAPDDLGGKILRLAPDGSTPPDNPFGPGSPVFTLGHRNSFGLCFDPATGQLWETENGPESHDEVNRIVAGKNYGWPDQSGPGGQPEFADPVLDFPVTEALTGCAVVGDVFWFGAYSAGRLHHATIHGTRLVDESSTGFDNITDLQLGPDGFLYVAATGAIRRFRVADAASPTPSGTSASPSAATPSPSASPTPASGRGSSGTVSFVVIAVLLALGIVVMRNRIRPPEDPPDPTLV
jgi:quinoprotein glucose dehydrogenase